MATQKHCWVWFEASANITIIILLLPFAEFGKNSGTEKPLVVMTGDALITKFKDNRRTFKGIGNVNKRK